MRQQFMGHDLLLEPTAPAYVLSLNYRVSPQHVKTIQQMWSQHGLGGQLIVLDQGATLTPIGVEPTPIFDALVAELGDPFGVAA